MDFNAEDILNSKEMEKVMEGMLSFENYFMLNC